MARLHFLTYETLMEDPENQICGFVHIGDFKGISTAHIACWNPTDFLRILKWGEQSIPMRNKEVHLVNVPSTVKYIIEAGKSMVSKKMKERLQVREWRPITTTGTTLPARRFSQVHVTPQELCRKMDPACLPKELGGTMPMTEMIEMWKMELAAKRNLVLSSEKMRILSDRGIVSRNGTDRNNNSSSLGMDTITGSFRKLEVD